MTQRLTTYKVPTRFLEDCIDCEGIYGADDRPSRTVADRIVWGKRTSTVTLDDAELESFKDRAEMYWNDRSGFDPDLRGLFQSAKATLLALAKQGVQVVVLR